MNIQQTYSRSIKSVCSLCVVGNNRSRTLSQKEKKKNRARGRHQMCTLPIKKRKESQKNKDEKTIGAQGRAISDSE